MKKLALLLLISLSMNFVQAQGYEFHHGVGASYVYVFEDEGLSQGAAGLTYTPRLVFMKMSKEASLSLNLSPTIVLSGEFSTQNGSNGSFGFELPASVNYNFGYGATSKSKSKAGGFMGVGYAISSLSTSTTTTFSGTDLDSNRVKGFYGEFGGRFEFRTPGMKKKRIDPMSLSVSLYTIRGGNANVGGFRLIVNFSR